LGTYVVRITARSAATLNVASRGFPQYL
jgi:hypothetical protein